MNTLKDHEAIKETMQIYMKGGEKGDSKIMRKAFHEDAIIHGYYAGEIFGGPIQKLYDWTDENGPASTVKYDVNILGLSGTCASVAVEIEDWQGSYFTDYFTLVKFDGHWLITAKVFMQHK